MKLKYNDLVLRNTDYISFELQDRIRNTKVLIAGCGIGSAFAESLVRIGCENITLIDGDTVSISNLNRQNFIYSDIGRLKVDALADRLTAINPGATITKIGRNLNNENTSEVLSNVDFIFDTVDFLDLPAIVKLHDEAKKQGKPVISALSIGWGAGCIYFPPENGVTFRDIFGIPENISLENTSYVSTFSLLIDKLKNKLDTQVLKAVSNALTIMEDGAPCPASQISVGAQSVAALALTMLVEILAEKEVVPAPMLITLDLLNNLKTSFINLQ